MPNDNNPPVFGKPAVFDLARYKPRQGKSALTIKMMAD